MVSEVVSRGQEASIRAALAGVPLPQPLLTSTAGVPLPQPLLTSTGSLATEWRQWRQLWYAYAVITDLSKKSSEYQASMFIACVGADA